MSVQKKHTGINKQGQRVTGVCSATAGNCPYEGGEETRHFYYDTSIKQEVLPPDSREQKIIRRVQAHRLDEFYADIPTDATRDMYNKARQEYNVANEAYEDSCSAALEKHPVPTQNFTQQLADSPTGDMVGGFDIDDHGEDLRKLPEGVTDKETLTLGQAFLNLEKAEAKWRSVISHAVLESGKSPI